jgi:hypothetical protein
MKIPKRQINEAFKRWFGQSKTAEAPGQPQVMYHATDADFDTFRPSTRGAYFTSPDPDFASRYVEDYADGQNVIKEGANVMPVFVRAENPFDYQNAAHIEAVMKAAKFPHKVDPANVRNNLELGNWNFIEDRNVQRAIKNSGFDGFYVNEHGVKNLGVFDPTQIKSAFNRGTWDPKDANILNGMFPLTMPAGGLLMDDDK